MRYESGGAKPAINSHSTKLKADLSNMTTGAIRPGPGIAGNGVYRFACDSEQDSAALNVAWDRGISGKYNECALFVFKRHGIIVNSNSKQSTFIAPPGATAHKNDQYSSHPGVIEYMSFTTTVDGLLGELSQQLDVLGYTQALRKDRMKVKTDMETETVSKGCDGIFLENIDVKPKRKSVVPTGASGKRESGKKDDEQRKE